MPDQPTRLLFICSQNRWRSLTAEQLFEAHPTVQARSAGTEAGARVRVAAGHLGWAEVIFVMERKHADRLRSKFGEALTGKPLVNLRIPDNYRLADPALVARLREQLAAYFKTADSTDLTNGADSTEAKAPVSGQATGDLRWSS